MQSRLIVLGMVFALLLGCLGGGEQAQNATNNTPDLPPLVPNPSFSISAPAGGQVITIDGDSTDVTLTLSTTNLVLRSPGGPAKKGEGHFRVTLDGGQPISVASKSQLLTGVTPGTHTIKVELLNNDRTKYVPGVMREVTFTVEKAPPKEYVPQNYDVTIENLAYSPKELDAKVSDTITFTNKGSMPMSATCFMEGKQVFDTKVLAKDQSAKVTLDREMECTFYSTTQRSVTGVVRVSANTQ